jgi:adhesin transport system outer membrane protein
LLFLIFAAFFHVWLAFQVDNPMVSKLLKKSPLHVLQSACLGVCLSLCFAPVALAQTNRGKDAAQPPAHAAFETLLLAALNTHPNVKSALALSQGSKYDVDAAKWGYWPTISVSALKTDEAKATATQNGSTLTIQQPLWTGGALTSRVAAAEKLEQSSVQQVDVTRGELALRLVEAWASLLDADANRAVASRTLIGLNRYRGIMMRRVDGGLSSDVELKLLSVRFSRAQTDLADANVNIQIALQRIEQLTGGPVQTTLDLKAPLPQDQLGAWVRTQAAAYASNRLSQHPAVRKAELDAQAAADQLAVQKASRWPQLVLSYQRSLDGAPADADRDLWALGLNYTPGAGFSNLSQSDAETARLRARLDAVDSVIQQKQEQLTLDWAALRREFERQETLKTTIASAQSVLASYERQYFGGLKSWQEVLNALQELSQSELRQAQAVNATTVAYYRWRLNGGDLPTNSNWVR